MSAGEAARQIQTVLRGRPAPPPLLPAAAWQPELSARIRGEVGELPAAASALLLWNDDLDGSHTLSQALPSSFGSWLHGIMHRREGDFSNSKYWFRKVGEHREFSALSSKLAATVAGAEDPRLRALAERWDPDGFVDLCAQASDGPDPDPGSTDLAAACLAIQLTELELVTALAIDAGLT